MKNIDCRKGQKGSVVIIAMLFLILLLGTGMGYLKWSADESVEFKRQFAAQMAYYLAQSAISMVVLPSMVEAEVVQQEIYFNGEAVNIDPYMANYLESYGMTGVYSGVARKDPAKSSQFAFNNNWFYDIEMTAYINYTSFNRYETNPEIVVDTTIHIQFQNSNSWAKYLYLTNIEVTIFGERIKFWGQDTLGYLDPETQEGVGWVHSNDQIAIMQNPVFYAHVSTCAESFYYEGGANPYFFYEPVFNADSIEFYTTLDDVRLGAYQQGYFFDDLGYGRKYILKFRGSQGYKVYRRWQEVPIDTYITTIPPLFGGAVFFDDTLEMTGTDTAAQRDYGVNGQLSIGASGDIWLGGNIRYVTADLYTGSFRWEDEQNSLGILSESDILIRNNWENGRDNGDVQTSEWRKSIIITAGFVALGESFSFEDQNDVPEAGGGMLKEWYYSDGPWPDERGDIHLWGADNQARRGYVHRSNHNGTGYGKDYNYDLRFINDPPPFYPKLSSDGSTKASRSIVSWGVGKLASSGTSGE